MIIAGVAWRNRAIVVVSSLIMPVSGEVRSPSQLGSHFLGLDFNCPDTTAGPEPWTRYDRNEISRQRH
jgi:hypothetical protein